MSIEFPTMIEFIEDVGMESLHESHESYIEDTGEYGKSFSNFVEEMYESHKQMFHDEMNFVKKIGYNVNDNIDISVEMAKVVLVEIINKAIQKGDVKKIILEEELAPDCGSAMIVALEFRKTVIPAIEKTLRHLGE
jgi:hypothetical protein